MGQPANTYDSYDFTHDREDFADTISMVTPEDTPFMSMIGTGQATNVTHEWTTDTLADADGTNAAIEGDDASPQALSAPTRVKNTTQISKKEFVVSGTTRAINVAGAEDEYLRQKLKKGIELKRDMEKILVGNQARVDGDSATARKLRSMESWFTTNVAMAGDGVNGTDTTARTDGTPRAFDEQQVKDLAELLYANSSEFPTVAMMAPKRRRGFSALAQQSTNRIAFEAGKLVTSVKVYETDFGDINLVNNRHMRNSGIAVINPELWKVAYLQGRDFVSEELAKTGDNVKHQMLSEYTLECKNEAGNGFIADLS
jgi:hypothetical protein